MSMTVNSNSCPCLSLCSKTKCSLRMKKSSGRPNRCKNFMGMMGNLNLSSSLLDDDWRAKMRCVSFRKHQWQRPGNLIVNELGGQYEEVFNDVKLEVRNYFTLKATRTVLYQLYEINPPQYTWLYNFVTENDPAEGKRFLRTLTKENQDLAERVMITRLHLYGKWIKKCDHAEIYKEIEDENLELMRERLMETIVWPVDDTKTE